MIAVREHHAPVGALRHLGPAGQVARSRGQGAPRTWNVVQGWF